MRQHQGGNCSGFVAKPKCLIWWLSLCLKSKRSGMQIQKDWNEMV